MDTSDPAITFDVEGVCNHCHKFDNITTHNWLPNARGRQQLNSICATVREAGKNKKYDCIIGLSGGIDSTYLAMKVKELGLRPLAVHVDAGWNTALAEENIKRIVDYCEYDLVSETIDWAEMRDLQLAYLHSGVANQDVPQDHAFFASLYGFAVRNKIRFVFSGGNIATESVFPDAWHHSAMDLDNILDIHRRFGTMPLRHYPTMSMLQYYLYYPFIYGMKTIRPLNYMVYDKAVALKILQSTIGYKDYGRKHGESLFTRFFQNHYLPVKFGYDKRRPHLSSKILSGQITRENAIQQLAEPLYDEAELWKDMRDISSRLKISVEDLMGFVSSPQESYTRYENWDKKFYYMKSMQRGFERIFRRRVSNYS